MVNNFYVEIEGQVLTRNSVRVYSHCIVCDSSSERTYRGEDGQEHEGFCARSYREGRYPKWHAFSWAGSLPLAKKVAARAEKQFKVVKILEVIEGKTSKIKVVR